MAQAESRYYRISPKFWRHARNSAWTERATHLAFYLLTCPHRNMVGLYSLPCEYVQADLGWDAAELDEAMEVLRRDDFLRYDAEASVVLIMNALDYDAPVNPNQVKAAMKQLEELPQTPLLMALVEKAAGSCKPLADAVRNRWPNRFVNPSPKPLVEPFTEQTGERSGQPVSVSVTASVTSAVAVPATNASEGPGTSGAGAHENPPVGGGRQRRSGPSSSLPLLNEDQAQAVEILRSIPRWPADPAADAQLVVDARAIAVQEGATDLSLSVVARELRQFLSTEPLKKGDHPRARFTNFVHTAVRRTKRLVPPGSPGPAATGPPRGRHYPTPEELDAGRAVSREEREAEYAATNGIASAARNPA